MTENRNGFVVEAELRQVSGAVERETAKDMIVRYSPGAKRITVGADKGFDTADFVSDIGEFGFRIRGGGVRLVAAPFAVKVALAIAPRRWRYPNRPSPRSSSSMPKLRPACHRPKSARPRAGHAPAFGQEARPETCAPPRPQAAGHGSS